MAHIAKIRRSGGARIVSIPVAILHSLDIDTDTKVKITVQEGAIVIKPCIEKKPTLEDLLEASPKESFTLTDEDHEWIHATKKGHEI